MSDSRSSSAARWSFRLGLLGASFVLVLLALNVPFYCGFATAHWNVRMEHGRVRVEHRAEPGRPKGFWLDGNSEGLRWKPEWKNYRGGNWKVNVPLWLLVFPCAALAIWGGAARRRPQG